MGRIFSQKKKRPRRRRSGPIASVVWDTFDLSVIRVYIGFTSKEALRFFLQELKGLHPPEYDDSLSELQKAVDRYKIEEIHGENVIMRRSLKYKLEF